MGDRWVYDVFCCTVSGDSHFVSSMINTVQVTVKPRFTANPNNRGNFSPQMEAELTITYITRKIKTPINRKPRFDAVIPFPKTPRFLLKFYCI